MKIFTGISLEACRLFGVRIDQGHFDTTSVNVRGDYASSAQEGPAPHVTYGYSKDKRPDLKQFLFSPLCVEGNIPLLGQVEDGNAADSKLNNETPERAAGLIAENQIDRESFLYVADCKLVNGANLALLGDSPFVTRLPASYKARAEVVDTALEADEWQALGSLNQTPQLPIFEGTAHRQRRVSEKVRPDRRAGNGVVAVATGMESDAAQSAQERARATRVRIDGSGRSARHAAGSVHSGA